jgi:hypothetical protein
MRISASKRRKSATLAGPDGPEFAAFLAQEDIYYDDLQDDDHQDGAQVTARRMTAVV